MLRYSLLQATIANNETAGGAAGNNIVAEFFSSMDMILVLQDGILTAKF